MGDIVSAFLPFSNEIFVLCQVRSCGPTICDKTQHVTAIIDVDGATICNETQHVTAIIDVDGATICDKTQHVTAIIDVDGATICDETQRVTTIIDVDGAPVVEPTHNSASGHLQSKLSTRVSLLPIIVYDGHRVVRSYSHAACG